MKLLKWLFRPRLIRLHEPSKPPVANSGPAEILSIGDEVVTALCGHATTIKAKIIVYGETHTGQINPNGDGKHELCHACIAAMIIPCAWCGQSIFPGDPITLYTPQDPNYQPPVGSIAYTKDPLHWVGCLRWDCAQTGGDRAGFWEIPGKVKRVMSPIEECLATHNPVEISDLADPSQTTAEPDENLN